MEQKKKIEYRKKILDKKTYLYVIFPGQASPSAKPLNTRNVSLKASVNICNPLWNANCS